MTNGGIGSDYNGTVFKITPSGTLTTLYSFCTQSNCTDGSNPHAGLVQGTEEISMERQTGAGPSRFWGPI
jgi:hypothetical protein